MAITSHHETDPATGEHHPASGPPVDLTAGRRRVARSRGALSGVLLIVLGAWAALAPFIGPYFDFALDPRSDDAWHWTSGRGLYELLPGAVAVLAGIVLLVSASRVFTLFMAWLAALAGAWLVVAPTLDASLDVGVGGPPTNAGTGKAVALALLFFLATGAAIVLVAGTALGRLSVHSVRDVRAAERRAEADAAAQAEAERAAARERERQEAERARHDETAAADTGHHEAPIGEHRDSAAREHDGAHHGEHHGSHHGSHEERPRDTAGSAGYSGYRSAEQPAAQPVQQPYPTQQAYPDQHAYPDQQTRPEQQTYPPPQTGPEHRP